MQQTELETLLAELRRTQDHQPPARSASAEEGSPPAGVAPALASPPLPTQEQLNSLLSALTNPQPAYSEPPPRDLTSLSFAESLPILQELAAGPDFLEALGEIQSNQADEELAMRDERNRLEGEGKRGALRCGLWHDGTRWGADQSDNTSQHVQNARLRDWDRKALVRWKLVREHQQGRLAEVRPSSARLDVSQDS